jgi:outer membrane protein assembly factor BamB
MQISPEMRGVFPDVPDPISFRCPSSGLEGWKVRIPGERAIPSPAVVDGRLFVSGGFGNFYFYTLDANDGYLQWQCQTMDDGPSAAVVTEEYVFFNTESCDLEVLSVYAEPKWKKWLGDPLLSLPSVANGRIFMSFPHSHGDKKHHLAAFDLDKGDELWRKPISGDILQAPVLSGDSVYFTNLDGTVSRFSQVDGKMIWSEKANATSAPVIWNDQCYFSQRTSGNSNKRSSSEQLAYTGIDAKSKVVAFKDSLRTANYLDSEKRKGSPRYKAHEAADASVGFGGTKGDSKIEQAKNHLGTPHIAGVVSFQGSRPIVSEGRLFSSMGNSVVCLDTNSRELLWKAKMDDGDETQVDFTLTTPIVANQKVFVGSLSGELRCLSSSSGEVLWNAKLGEPILHPPVVANGRIYVSTTKGSVFALNTGDPKDDGWLMWGGTGAHNGLVGV